MKRASVMVIGEAVGMVWTPEPGIANSTTSSPGAALESRTAWRNDPGPESFVFVTVRVVAASGAAPTPAASTTASEARRMSRMVSSFEHHAQRERERDQDSACARTHERSRIGGRDLGRRARSGVAHTLGGDE